MSCTAVWPAPRCSISPAVRPTVDTVLSGFYVRKLAVRQQAKFINNNMLPESPQDSPQDIADPQSTSRSEKTLPIVAVQIAAHQPVFSLGSAPLILLAGPQESFRTHYNRSLRSLDNHADTCALVRLPPAAARSRPSRRLQPPPGAVPTRSRLRTTGPRVRRRW